MQADYYKILAVGRDADELMLKCAYHKLAVEHHPDRNPGIREAEEQFKQVAEAYGVLSDPVRRRAYDAATGNAGLTPAFVVSGPPSTQWGAPSRILPYAVAIATALIVIASISGTSRILAGWIGPGQQVGLQAPVAESTGSTGEPAPRPVSDRPRPVKSTGRVSVARGARPIRSSEAPYPPEALRQGVSGLVELQITIGEDGSLLNPRVLSGDPLLAQGLPEAIGGWRFQPMRVNGRPAPLTTEMTLRFDLGR